MTLSENKDNIQTCAAEGPPFLDMNVSWYPKGDPKFWIFRNKGQQLKYVVKGITHIPGTLCMIQLVVLDRLVKLTLRKPDLKPKRVDSLYLNHDSTLCKLRIAPSILSTMVQLRKDWDEKRIMTSRMTQLTTKLKTEISIFASRTRVISIRHTQGDQQT